MLVKILHISQANVPFRFRAHQQGKYSSLPLTTLCITAYASFIPPCSSGMACVGLILIATVRFPKSFLNSCIIQGHVQVFSVYMGALMTNTDLAFQHFVSHTQNSKFNSALAINFLFHDKWRNNRVNSQMLTIDHFFRLLIKGKQIKFFSLRLVVAIISFSFRLS